MSNHVGASVLKKNWYLALAVVGLFAAGGYSALKGDAAVDETTIRIDPNSAAFNASSRMQASRWAKPTKVRELESNIEGYERELATNPESSETAANLYRLANLYYSGKHDYEEATVYYERLLSEFPDYRGLQTVFPNLVACYERLDERQLARHTYKRMMDHFGPGTQEYLFAQQKMEQ